MRVFVMGDGGWGTALACVLADRGHAVALWSHDVDYAGELARTHLNRKFLPGVKILPSVRVTADAGEARQAELVVVAVPTIYLRTVLSSFVGAICDKAILASVVKGVEQGTLKRPSEIVEEHFEGKPTAVVSGPSHAEEVALGLPTSVVAAAKDLGVARRVQEAFGTPLLRVYASTDVVGVELGGALKNVIGVAAGICEGLGFGHNSLAALLTRGLAEITRLGVALGARAATFRGLSGMGDLITTCFSPYGRNRHVGIEIGKGRKLADVVAEMEMVAEGIHTTRAALALAAKCDVEMPITREVAAILFEGKNPRRAVTDLMTRELREEKESFDG
ncbi:MAG: NAD(P)H-dependent glycerol-3-phosphate dehydrogenase [Planctomycetota bacterium]